MTLLEKLPAIVCMTVLRLMILGLLTNNLLIWLLNILLPTNPLYTLVHCSLITKFLARDIAAIHGVSKINYETFLNLNQFFIELIADVVGGFRSVQNMIPLLK